MEVKLNKCQKKTIKEVLEKLQKFGKCLLIRPTGWGKTTTSMTIMKKYKKVFFIYPATINRDAVEPSLIKSGIKNVSFYSYALIRNFYKKGKLQEEFGLKMGNNCLFIFDEAHKTGGNVTQSAILSLMNNICKKAHYLGITATPDRTDRVDIRYHIFDGITPFEYTIEDAFNDGLFKEPYYVLTMWDKDSLIFDKLAEIDLKEGYSEAKKEQMKNYVIRKLNRQKFTVENLDEILINNFNKFQNEDEYYQFVCYYSSFKELHSRTPHLVKSFEKAFPKYNVNPIIITSETPKYKENVNIVRKLKRRGHTIDLLININMLSESLHSDNLTGVMMFRPTISSTIYSQQAGRALKVGSTMPGIIFDFVENYNRFGFCIWKDDDTSNCGMYNNLGLGVPPEYMIMDDETKAIMDVERFIHNQISDKYTEEVVNAYKLGLVDVDYCCAKLNLQTINDFDKVLRRYSYE